MILRVAQSGEDARSVVDGAFNSDFFVPNIVASGDFQVNLVNDGFFYAGTYTLAHNLDYIPDAFVIVKPTETTRIPLQVSQGSPAYDYMVGTAHCTAASLVVDIQKDLTFSTGTLTIDGYYYLIKP